MVKRSLLRSLLLVTAAAVPYAGCSGKTVGQSAGGETNWLAMCTSNAECVAGAECLCGVCTKECTDDTACNGATCTRSGTEAFLDACQTEAKTPSGICLTPCTFTKDCKDGLVCIAAACMPQPHFRTYDASAGGGTNAGGATGSAGAGGAGGAAMGGARTISDAGLQGTGGRGGIPDSSSAGGAVSTGTGGAKTSGAGGNTGGQAGDGSHDGSAGTGGGAPTDGGEELPPGCTNLQTSSADCVLARCTGGDTCAACSGDGTPTITGETAPTLCGDDNCNKECFYYANPVKAPSAGESDAGDGSVVREISLVAQCPTGRTPHWETFSYSANRPAGSKIALSLDFQKQEGGTVSGTELGTLGFTDPSNLPDDCTLYGPASKCPIDIPLLLKRSRTDWPLATLKVTLVPSAAGAPSLKWYELRYTCQDPFAATCSALGRTWANGSSGLRPDGCTYEECRYGSFVTFGSGCANPPVCGCDGETYAGDCTAGVGSIGACTACYDGEITAQSGGRNCVCRDGNPTAICDKN